MNKYYKQVSSDDLQMSLAGGPGPRMVPMSHVWREGRAGRGFTVWSYASWVMT